MRSDAASPSFFVGWDVGGWNCDKNGSSRDALVILDETLTIVGQPWRGNLRECIASAKSTSEWLNALFEKCRAGVSREAAKVTMAIDTPLGFPDAFISLVTGQGRLEPDEISGKNGYLFRDTERHLFEQGFRPLSAIKDMIGSQATKGMHVLSKFAPQLESCGVWTDGQGFRAIETYPTACRGSKVVNRLLQGRAHLGHADMDDALVCAVVAHLFVTSRETLEGPSDAVPHREGWIWATSRTHRI